MDKGGWGGACICASVKRALLCNPQAQATTTATLDFCHFKQPVSTEKAVKKGTGIAWKNPISDAAPAYSGQGEEVAGADSIRRGFRRGLLRVVVIV